MTLRAMLALGFRARQELSPLALVVKIPTYRGMIARAEGSRPRRCGFESCVGHVAERVLGLEHERVDEWAVVVVDHVDEFPSPARWSPASSPSL